MLSGERTASGLPWTERIMNQPRIITPIIKLA